jgi:thioesterase domain-containing protein
MLAEQDHRRSLGQKISELLEQRDGLDESWLGADESVVRLREGGRGAASIVLLPGAGASVTCFNDVIETLDDAMPIYGLQPRGLIKSHPPHMAVEAAAAYHLAALESLPSTEEVHLIGHSFGGWVAFELACRIQQRGGRIASLTLVDSRPPSDAGQLWVDITEPDLFRDYRNAIERTFGEKLELSEACIESGDRTLFLEQLHQVMVKANLLPARSKAESLRGALDTYACARRVRYTPLLKYRGTLNLVLAASSKGEVDDFAQRMEQASRRWSGLAEFLNIQSSMGDHFSILRGPHARTLTTWWRESVKGERS